jgi:hypothetical protein
MKNYRKFIAALVFVLVLSVSAFAGEMQTGRDAPPSTAPSEMHTDRAASTTKADITTGFALDFLQSLLSLL